MAFNVRLFASTNFNSNTSIIAITLDVVNIYFNIYHLIILFFLWQANIIAHLIYIDFRFSLTVVKKFR